MKTKVRVKRAELLKVVDGRVHKAERELKRAREAHPAKVAAWEGQVIATLEKALVQARKGKTPGDRYGRVQIPAKPTPPNEARELCNLRRMRATLRMGADESLLLSQEDADAYFGPCRV